MPQGADVTVARPDGRQRAPGPTARFQLLRTPAGVCIAPARTLDRARELAQALGATAPRR